MREKIVRTSWNPPYDLKTRQSKHYIENILPSFLHRLYFEHHDLPEDIDLTVDWDDDDDIFGFRDEIYDLGISEIWQEYSHWEEWEWILKCIETEGLAPVLNHHYSNSMDHLIPKVKSKFPPKGEPAADESIKKKKKKRSGKKERSKIQETKDF